MSTQTLDAKMHPYRALGDWMRARRKDRNLTQRKLAAMVDRSFTTIAHIERGDSLPGKALREPLCGALGVDVQDMIREMEKLGPTVILGLLRDYGPEVLSDTVRSVLFDVPVPEIRGAVAGLTGCVTTVAGFSPAEVENAGGRFGLRVTDDTLRPIARPNDWILADAGLDPQNGDRVIAQVAADRTWLIGEAKRSGDVLSLAPILGQGDSHLHALSEFALVGVWVHTVYGERALERATASD